MSTVQLRAMSQRAKNILRLSLIKQNNDNIMQDSKNNCEKIKYVERWLNGINTFEGVNGKDKTSKNSHEIKSGTSQIEDDLYNVDENLDNQMEEEEKENSLFADDSVADPLYKPSETESSEVISLKATFGRKRKHDDDDNFGKDLDNTICSPSICSEDTKLDTECSKTNYSASSAIIQIQPNIFALRNMNEESNKNEHLRQDPIETAPCQSNIISNLLGSNKKGSITKVDAGNNTIYDKENEEADGVEKVTDASYYDKFTFCFYCEKDVDHFSRHIFTWHFNEIDVQKIMGASLKSKKRRELIKSLRKKGDFLRNRITNVLRPVKRLVQSDTSLRDSFLPCTYCFGFYKRKSLFKHTRKCPENREINTKQKRQTSQSDGQSALLVGTLFKHDKLLVKELFPRMRADKTNLIAQRDFLICQYAYSYMKGRKTKGNLDLVRQNMRRLSKLFQFCSAHENINGIIDLLKPTKFSLILKAVNHIARYNAELEKYESPTVAMNFGTLLKKICDLAYIHYIQIENTNDQRKDLKILKKLIESQWSDEISAQAGLNLNENKWNKNDLIPLTNDIKNMNKFLKEWANQAFLDLQNDNTNIRSYNLLKEIVYAQIILLNRRRPAEVAQMNVDKYLAINLKDNSGNTEFENCLTESERILLNSYCRIVIRGKRGRGVPILLSPDMKKHFDYFISLRHQFVNQNKYIFHSAGQGFLDGTKILYKYAEKCGTDNPKSISATKLRKHLATITQLLHFDEKELEQLSQFMGHTLKTHFKVYRMSDNLYQTAKVSKLLLLMSEGGIEQYKGKNLDEIEIDLTNPIIEEDQIKDKIISYKNDDSADITSTTIQVPSTSSKMNCRKIPIVRHKWNIEQKRLIAQHFKNNIKEKRPPKKFEVEAFQEQQSEEFRKMKWTTIKAVVFNMYKGNLNQPT
ncbi:unnamed protein product [Diabrotica balteata]|uniref:Uncharacterized protein n=1 Tax=Diabrotica balteata TaxID=107213 RepID=A0A9N9TCE9_DIABA|nr:unnamed protein product [Diabrotica balteata]